MPCHADCYLQRILLAKEMKISKLQQVDRWVDALYRQEPQRRNKIIVKKAVVANQIDTIQVNDLPTDVLPAMHIKTPPRSCPKQKNQEAVPNQVSRTIPERSPRFKDDDESRICTAPSPPM